MDIGLWIGLAVSLLFVFGLIIARIRSSVPWVGPLYWYELVRLARRAGQPKLRVAYAILLLIGLLVLYLKTFSNVNPVSLLFDANIQLPQSERARFTESFSFTYFIIQIVFVSLITPVYSGGAIIEEKQTKALDFLQSSMLSNHEIVLGKLAARLTFIFCTVLVGLPILSLVLLFGGLDPLIVLYGFIITFVTMLGLSGLSLLMGIYRNTLRDALYWPYGLLIGLTLIGFCSCCPMLPFLAGLSPITLMTMLYALNANGGAGMFAMMGVSSSSYSIILVSVFCVLYLGMFFVCTILAIRSIRNQAEEKTIHRRRRIKSSKQAPDSQTPVSQAPDSPVPAIEKGILVDAENLTDIQTDELQFEESNDDNAQGPLAIAQKAAEKNNKQRNRSSSRDSDKPKRVVSRRRFTVPQIGKKDPFLWKEQHFSGRLPMLESGCMMSSLIAFFLVVVTVIGIVIFVNALDNIARGVYPSDAMNMAIRFIVVSSVLILSPILGLKAATMINKERQQETLLSLLTIPEARERILFAKFLAPIHAQRYWLISMLVCVVLSLIFGGIHPTSFIAGTIYLVGFLAFANSYGLWLSSVCKTTTRSMSVFFCTILALFIGPWIVGTLIRALIQAFSTDLTMAMILEAGFENINPLVALTRIFMTWNEFNSDNKQTQFATTISVGMIGMIYCGLAYAFWIISKRLFIKLNI